jgi:DNA polymerase-3 subunit epsilon
MPPGPSGLEDGVAHHGDLLFMRSVADAGDFAEVWADLSDRFSGLPLVAHNAVFDMGVIRASAESRGLNLDPTPYVCSVKLSRAAWPDMKSVRLNLVAERLGLDLDHHNAESDARACGEITLHALERLKADSLEALVAERGWTWGKLQ